MHFIGKHAARFGISVCNRGFQTFILKLTFILNVRHGVTVEKKWEAIHFKFVVVLEQVLSWLHGWIIKFQVSYLCSPRIHLVIWLQQTHTQSN